LPSRPLDLAQVRAALDAGQAHASALGVEVAVAVVGADGELLGLLRSPRAFLTTRAVAVAKAFTALNFGASTGVLSERITPESRASLSALDRRLAFIRGGVPVGSDCVTVGGIGVSGATAEQDEEIAHSAASVLGPGGEPL
jgi:uncharacterized protein GlcG (DUF336 family)